jgi:2-methylcitrate dehydratase PrpD
MTGAPAARRLAEFAVALDCRDVPEAALERARQCIVDTAGAALFGSRLPWAGIAARYACCYGAGGASRIIGTPHAAAAPLAALANGVAAHAFELDSLRRPGAGVHPGAALLPPALAIAEETGAGGRSLLAAFVAGCEVMFRIGIASRHSSEEIGFHAPGLTGPFGAAVAAGRLLGLDAARLTHALGIAGSLCGGLLAFAKAGNGAMVKRLHLGRAAEAGVLAARLARDGYEGPDAVLEGRYGFLDAFCRDADAAALTRGLGTVFETQTLCIKRYACHITAHTPVQSLLALRREHGFGGDEVARLTVLASAKVLSHHANAEPGDVAAAQYSVPFCAAIALYHDPLDPRAFSERTLADPRVRAAARAVELGPLQAGGAKRSAWASRVAVQLRDGRTFEREADDFPGTPASPLDAQALREKFLRLAGDFPGAARLCAQLETLDAVRDCRALALSGK